MYRSIQLQAGFIQFSQCNFDEARDLFHSGQLDMREVNKYYCLKCVIYTALQHGSSDSSFIARVRI